MTTFIAIYRGASVGDAQLIAVSADSDIVADVSTMLLRDRPSAVTDNALMKLDRGRRAALRVIKQEATDASAR